MAVFTNARPAEGVGGQRGGEGTIDTGEVSQTAAVGDVVRPLAGLGGETEVELGLAR